jgi:hypothetical protein
LSLSGLREIGNEDSITIVNPNSKRRAKKKNGECAPICHDPQPETPSLTAKLKIPLEMRGPQHVGNVQHETRLGSELRNRAVSRPNDELEL